MHWYIDVVNAITEHQGRCGVTGTRHFLIHLCINSKIRPSPFCYFACFWHRPVFKWFCLIPFDTIFHVIFLLPFIFIFTSHFSIYFFPFFLNNSEVISLHTSFFPLQSASNTFFLVCWFLFHLRFWWWTLMFLSKQPFWLKTFPMNSSVLPVWRRLASVSQ